MSGAPRPADVLVIFGITGNLARVMTFRSLYRLEARGLLACPVVGVAVDDWQDADLHARARESIVGTGETIDEDVFARLTGRMTYVGGDFTDDATYARVRDAVGEAHSPVHYLEVPPSLFATVVHGLAGAGLTRGARVVVEKPFGHDGPSARALAEELHDVLDERQILRIDHFLGKMGLEELLFLRFANTVLEPLWSRTYLDCVQITLSERFGVEDRGHFYDPVGALRDVVVNHLLQVLAAAAMEAPVRRDPEVIKDAQLTVLRAVNTAEPAHYVRGQVDGYLGIDGVAAGSATETYAAVRLDLDTWRWSGVPFFVRTGKNLAVTQTEVRLVFRQAPNLGFGLRDDDHDPNQLVVRLDPATGVRLQVDAKRADATGAEPITLDMRFADEGGEGPTPYEVLLHDALVGNTMRFARQDVVEEQWRIMAPLLESPPPVVPYAAGTMGPAEADALVAAHGGWHDPWLA